MDINEVTMAVLILLGFIPICTYFIKSKYEAKWFFLGYFCLLIGAVATILEEFFFPIALNYIEHIIGIVGASVFLFLAAYIGYRKVSAFTRKGARIR